MSGVAICTCATYNHLHEALTLVRSIRRTWRTEPSIFVILVDQVDRPRPGFESVAGVEFLAADTLGVPDLAWQLCKLLPGEVCCLLKPFAIRWLMDRDFDRILYVDSDMHFFADGTPFVNDLREADFLVTPHLTSPLPFAEPWTRVTMGHLSHAGVLNAGLLVARNTRSARAFIQTWSQLCAGPGAFLCDLGGQHEQQHFNWIYAFSDRVRLSRDPRVNVAYWNLHERPIRWGGLDDGDAESWSLNGDPIICFHFSGFAWDRGRLSIFDDRSRPTANANLFALCEYYARQLARSGEAHYSSAPYGFSRAGGVELDPEIRIELKRSESRGTPDLEEWPLAGPAVLRRLNTTLGDTSLVPKYLEPVHDRLDLAPFHDPLFARQWLRWADLGLWRDHDVLGQIYEQAGQFVFHRGFVDALAHEIGDGWPTIDEGEIARRLKTERLSLLQSLMTSGTSGDVLQAVNAASYRTPAFVPAGSVRLIYSESQHLQQQFPDVAGMDAARFEEWLRVGFHQVFECPDAVLQFVRRFAFERSVAHILGKSLRMPPLIDRVRRDGFDRACLFSLVRGAQSECGYDADDLVVMDWWLEQGGESARTRISEVLPPEAGESGFQRYLAAWCRQLAIVDQETSDETVLETAGALEQWLITTAGVAVAAADRFTPSARAWRGPAVRDAAVEKKLGDALTPDRRGVNVFGYFKSPIGLGTATKGLCQALDVAGYRHRDLVIPNDAMDEDCTLTDLFQDFAFNYPRNMVVTYPHIEYQLQSVRPKCFFSGRETIAYLAWEQRDFHSGWAERLAPYDRLCALSRFSADAIARGVKRPVDVLPCVVETGEPVAKDEARRRFGIPAGKFVVGFVFDAASSIERKNPWAVIEAVAKAFAGSPDVMLVMKVGSGKRPDFAPQVRELIRRAAVACPGSIVITDHLPKAEVDRLLCAMDVYVSLHRSEGFGYTLAEAMLLGVPAVATRYSGNVDFMTDRNSHLVCCREVPVRQREGPFETGTVWAEPDIDHAVAILRGIRADYPAALALARTAVPDLQAVVSPQAVAGAVTAVLEGTAVPVGA